MAKNAVAPEAHPLRGADVLEMTTGVAAHHPDEGDLHTFVAVWQWPVEPNVLSVLCYNLACDLLIPLSTEYFILMLTFCESRHFYCLSLLMIIHLSSVSMTCSFIFIVTYGGIRTDRHSKPNEMWRGNATFKPGSVVRPKIWPARLCTFAVHFQVSTF